MKYMIVVLMFMANYWWVFGIMFALAGFGKLIFTYTDVQ